MYNFSTGHTSGTTFVSRVSLYVPLYGVQAVAIRCFNRQVWSGVSRRPSIRAWRRVLSSIGGGGRSSVNVVRSRRRSRRGPGGGGGRRRRRSGGRRRRSPASRESWARSSRTSRSRGRANRPADSRRNSTRRHRRNRSRSGPRPSSPTLPTTGGCRRRRRRRYYSRVLNLSGPGRRGGPSHSLI